MRSPFKSVKKSARLDAERADLAYRILHGELHGVVEVPASLHSEESVELDELICFRCDRVIVPPFALMHVNSLLLSDVSENYYWVSQPIDMPLCIGCKNHFLAQVRAQEEDEDAPA